MKSNSERKDAVLLLRTIQQHDPEYLHRYAERLKHLPVIYDFYALLPSLLTAFCTYSQVAEPDIVGTNKGSDINQLKEKFVGAMVLCYHPDLITGHDDKAKDRLCKEIAFVMGLQREQVSQYASNTIRYLNPDKKFSTTYMRFKEEMAELVEYLKENVQVGEVKAIEPVDLFQEA